MLLLFTLSAVVPGDPAVTLLGPQASPEYAARFISQMGLDQPIKAAKGGQVEFRAEKAGLIHAGVGKASFTEKALVENVKAFVSAINKAKPSGSKGTYIKKVSIASTMGPGVKLEVSTLVG